jgi:hypothetical protein
MTPVVLVSEHALVRTLRQSMPLCAAYQTAFQDEVAPAVGAAGAGVQCGRCLSYKPRQQLDAIASRYRQQAESNN